MSRPKTFEVIKDGRVGRGVKVTARNYIDVSNWVTGGFMRGKSWIDNFSMAVVGVAKGKPDSKHRVEILSRKSRRVANVGDVVVKFRYRDDVSGYDCREYEVIKAADFNKGV